MKENETLQTAETDGDLLPVVNEHDEVIGIRPRREVHLYALRHRAVHIIVTDPAGNVWLQQRAATKDTFPLYWDLSATGHVDPDESYEAAARRELREELCICGAPQPVMRIEASARTGWEFHMIYRLAWQSPILNFNRREIAQMRLFSLDEIRAAIGGERADWKLTPGVEDAFALLLADRRMERMP